MIELAEQFRNGMIDVDGYINAIQESFDAEETTIFSFVPEAQRWDRLRTDLEALLIRWPDAGERPTLFGAPIAAKDIFRADGLPTRAGSSLPPEVLVGDESVCVTALKEAGAVIIGKTITTEFAWFGPGPARNPHNPLHTPGGSSSGSAAAVGAGIVPIALGSQTIGSVNRPAAFCGCVGFKPSYNRISKEGVIELSDSHDHVGVICDSVGSAELALAVMTPDWKGKEERGKGKEKPVLGVPVGAYLDRAEPVGLEHFWQAVAYLEAQGYTIKRVEAMADFDELEMRHKRLLSADAARYHAQFADYHHMYHHRTRELIADGALVADEEIAADKQAKCDLADRLTELMDANGVDLWLTPSATGPAPLGHASTGNPIMQLPFTMAGLPTLNIPYGMVDGLPMALQFVGRFGTDEDVIAFGYGLERALD